MKTTDDTGASFFSVVPAIMGMARRTQKNIYMSYYKRWVRLTLKEEYELLEKWLNATIKGLYELLTMWIRVTRKKSSGC